MHWYAGFQSEKSTLQNSALENKDPSFEDVEGSVPRDRKNEFEPQLLKKNQTSISQDIEERIPSMYAKGMMTGDIETHIRDI